MPRILVVAQAFKESFSASEVAVALRNAAEAVGGEPHVVQGSDGGDGLLDALGSRLARRTRHRVPDPLGRSVDAEVGWLDPAWAVVESRLVCGLGLLRPEERNPLETSTGGLGVLIAEVVAAGARAVAVGLGGSATVDGGAGMARAWGWIPRDAGGAPLPEGGGALAGLATLEAGRGPPAALTALCDVRNPLLGERGARVFAPQKGATPEMTERLDRGLGRLAALAERDGRAALARQPGAGAAGGLGFGLAFFGGAELVPGAPWVLSQVGFAEALRRADLVVVGEGAFDRTSLEGKLPGEVLSRARAMGVPVLLVAPRASDVPAGVAVEMGGGWWSLSDLAGRTAAALRRVLRLPEA